MPKWSPDLETGYKELDDQHRRIFRLIGITITAVETKMDKRCVVAVLEETYDYLLRHTGVEEELMLAFSYPEIEAHRQEHKSMLVEIRRLSDDYAELGHRAIVTVKLETMLVRWVREHIKSLDKKMVEFLLKQKTH